MKWPVAKLEQIAATGTGGTPLRDEGARFFGGRIPWIKSGELKDALLTSAAETITDEALAGSNAKLVPAGAVLIALYGATVGRTALLGFEATTNQAVCHIIPDNRLADPRFVWYALRAELPELLRKRVGGAQPNISQHIIRSTKIPLPPLREQWRIVELLEQADGLRRRQEEAEALADRILPALFHKMFGDPAANPKRWPREKLSMLLNGIDSGWSPVCETRPARPDEWGVLKLGAVTSNRYLDCENKALPADENPQPDLEVKPGDLLFSLKNTRELVGACAYVKATRPKLMLSDLIFRLRLKADAEINPLYLWALLTTPGKRPTIEVLAGGSAGSMPNISKGRLETLEIEKPPKPLQDQFSCAVVESESLRGNMGAARENLEKLFSVLLHRAFTGELTAKWREAHLKELLAEMGQQARLLNVKPTEN